jgi:hypothetical protein
VVEALTVPACTEILPVVPPAGMMRLDGIGNAELLVDVRPTCAPFCGAGPFSITVTDDDDPLIIVDGLIVKLVKVGPVVLKLKTADQFPYCCVLRACTSQ